MADSLLLLSGDGVSNLVGIFSLLTQHPGMMSYDTISHAAMQCFAFITLVALTASKIACVVVLSIRLRELRAALSPPAALARISSCTSCSLPSCGTFPYPDQAQPPVQCSYLRDCFQSLAPSLVFTRSRAFTRLTAVRIASAFASGSAVKQHLHGHRSIA